MVKKFLLKIIYLQENVVSQDEKKPDKKPKLTNKEIYANLKKQLASIKQSCGEVCNTSIKGIDGKYYKFIEKEVNCEALFSNPDIDAEAEFQRPPSKIPKYL